MRGALLSKFAATFIRRRFSVKIGGFFKVSIYKNTTTT
ncbi:hypothetical protein RG47T_1190 [Mucilaginibacter polytrichastri]|uniref:Uncharacterized protein n=1 Tax=Mucilaginibacter polytrichastri TaxID=1302689 RepID=A0A1Q5ZVD8_9SPHI|nr:hypothetical protein RG47T_1190 [Mucilaginibacter polytrichastri]